MKIEHKHKLLTVYNLDWFLFFLTIISLGFLVDYWSRNLKSSFYIVFCFIPLLGELAVDLYFFIWAWGSELKNLKYNKKLFFTWWFIKGVVLVYLLIVFQRPYNLSGEVHGFGARPYAGKSSCTTDTRILNNNIYSTQGVFNSRNPWDITKNYAFCVLNQRWASSSGTPIPGYARSGGEEGVLLCDEPIPNGYMYSSASKDGCGEVTYKTNLAFGLDLRSVTNEIQVYDLTNASVVACPSTLGKVDLIPSYRRIYNGVGMKIKPACLNSHRIRRGSTTGPSGYDDYVFDESEPESWFCVFCPGGPEGQEEFWLSEEGYSPGDLHMSLVVYTILLIYKFLRLIIHLIVYRSLQKKKRNEQQEKKK